MCDNAEGKSTLIEMVIKKLFIIAMLHKQQ